MSEELDTALMGIETGVACLLVAMSIVTLNLWALLVLSVALAINLFGGANG